MKLIEGNQHFDIYEPPEDTRKLGIVHIRHQKTATYYYDRMPADSWYMVHASTHKFRMEKLVDGLQGVMGFLA